MCRQHQIFIQNSACFFLFPCCEESSFTSSSYHFSTTKINNKFLFIFLCKMNQSIILVAILAVMLETAYGQLIINSDQFHNSYSVQTPHMQQTFTRYYGNQPGGLQAARQTVQQPQYVSRFNILNSSVFRVTAIQYTTHK